MATGRFLCPVGDPTLMHMWAALIGIRGFKVIRNRGKGMKLGGRLLRGLEGRSRGRYDEDALYTS